MKKKIITTVIVICCLLFLLGGLIVGGLFMAIKSGRLERYIELRAKQATGLQVQIGSLHLRWPLVVSADAISAAVPGDQEQPLLVSERLQVTTSLRALLRRQTFGLVSLSVAYLQYYFIDVQLQIISLPSVTSLPLVMTLPMH